MKLKSNQSFTTLFTLVMLMGCEVPELDNGPVAETSAPAGVAEEEPAEVATSPGEPPAVTDEPREFTAKDPKKGKKSRAVGGYAGAVFGARFWAEHETIRISVEHALNLYNAEHGNYPKTHDEFMDKIIKYNQIQLPELDEGVEYVYDPEDHTLKVYRPEK